jgi:hypothetical protein
MNALSITHHGITHAQTPIRHRGMPASPRRQYATRPRRSRTLARASRRRPSPNPSVAPPLAAAESPLTVPVRLGAWRLAGHRATAAPRATTSGPAPTVQPSSLQRPRPPDSQPLASSPPGSPFAHSSRMWLCQHQRSSPLMKYGLILSLCSVLFSDFCFKCLFVSVWPL